MKPICVLLIVKWALVLQLMLVRYTSQSPVLLNLKENRISNHNDTHYVDAVMRRAKAAEMLNYMNEKIDPCENFYEFACGNWPKINPALGLTSRETNFFELLTNAYDRKQSKLLKEGAQKTDSAIDAMVKNFYAGCLNIGNLKHIYKAQLREIIEEFGAMPVLDANWNFNEFDWISTIASVQNRFGLDIILQMGIRQDFEHPDRNKLYVGQPSLRLGTKSMYLNEDTQWHRNLYRQEIADNLEFHLGVSKEVAQVTATQILSFEIRLAQGIGDRKLGLSLKAMTHLRTVAELQAMYQPTIDFGRYLTVALGHEFNDTLYEYLIEYQLNLVKVIHETPKDQLANYIFYQLAQYFFFKINETPQMREKICLSKTKAFFAKVLDNMTYRHYNSEGTQRDINLIWQQLKYTFKQQLETSEDLNWMTWVTRRLAVEKLAAMKLEINSYAADNLTTEYVNLTSINNRDYLENVQRVLEFETQRILATLNEKPKPLDSAVIFSYSPAHISSENLIRIPVLLLQPNFLWSDRYPNALKFGTLGYLVAHELMHGFDDLGRDYDISGKQLSWWDKNSTEGFNERKQCFKHQYARYRYGGKYLPESELQSENIADNGGLQVAYKAYKNWLQNIYDANGIEGGDTDALSQKLLELEVLPSLNYTNRQLFFISFAQFWCSDVNERFKDKVSLVDVHAPAMFRVIGSLANFNEFSKEFNCAKGTTMNPEKQCKIY